MVERPMPHCVACREEVEGDISLLSKNCKNNVRNSFDYFMLKFQETSLVTVTSVENPQFVELPPQRIVGSEVGSAEGLVRGIGSRVFAE